MRLCDSFEDAGNKILDLGHTCPLQAGIRVTGGLVLNGPNSVIACAVTSEK